MRREKRVAIYGGSFDPPHIGHTAVIEEAFRTLPIDRLILVPTAQSPFKSGHTAPARTRLAWLEKIAADDPRLEVSDCEIAREGPSYTIDTVHRFAPFFDTIYLIVGADNLEGLSRWHRFEELDRMVRWVVADREGRPIPEGFLRLRIDVPVSSSELRERMDPSRIPAPIRKEVAAFYAAKPDGYRES